MDDDKILYLHKDQTDMLPLHVSHVIGKNTITYANRKGSSEPVHPHSLARIYNVRSRKK